MSVTSPTPAERPRINGSSAVAGPATAAGPRADAASISDDAIAKLAYEKFIARGCAHGRDEEDWAAAKRDLSIGLSGA